MKKNALRICIILLIPCVLLIVLFLIRKRGSGGTDAGQPTTISLADDEVRIAGKGASAKDGSVLISSPGTYLLSGTLTDGKITVDAGKSDRVTLRFGGVDISCQGDACLSIVQADAVSLILEDGTENRLTGGKAMSEDAESDGVSGCIFSRDDLTIDGNGSLIVKAGFKHGITAKDDLSIRGGSIVVNAPADGLHVSDSFLLDGGALEIRAGDDGIHADSSIVIKDGSVRIDECYEGIEALTVDIRGGDISIRSGDDGINAQGDSAEETWLHISGGNILIINDSATDADGLDSNGDILISGGSVHISLVGIGRNTAIDCGLENGGVLKISGGEVIACGSFVMAEPPAGSSTQASILCKMHTPAEAGTPVRLLDSKGSTLLAWEVPCRFNSLLLSCPGMDPEGEYALTIGDQESSVTPSDPDLFTP